MFRTTTAKILCIIRSTSQLQSTSLFQLIVDFSLFLKLIISEVRGVQPVFPSQLYSFKHWVWLKLASRCLWAWVRNGSAPPGGESRVEFAESLHPVSLSSKGESSGRWVQVWRNGLVQFQNGRNLGTASVRAVAGAVMMTAWGWRMWPRSISSRGKSGFFTLCPSLGQSVFTATFSWSVNFPLVMSRAGGMGISGGLWLHGPWRRESASWVQGSKQNCSVAGLGSSLFYLLTVRPWIALHTSLGFPHL